MDVEDVERSPKLVRVMIFVGIFVFGLGMLALLLMRGCVPENEPGDAASPPSQTAPAATTEQQPAEAAQPGEYRAGAWRLSGFDTYYDDQYHGMTAQSGEDIQSINFYADHSAETALALHNDDFTLKGASGATYELAQPDNELFNAESGPIEPKYSRTMRLGYQVPETEKSFTLVFTPKDGGNGESAEIPIEGK